MGSAGPRKIWMKASDLKRFVLELHQKIERSVSERTRRSLGNFPLARLLLCSTVNSGRVSMEKAHVSLASFAAVAVLFAASTDCMVGADGSEGKGSGPTAERVGQTEAADN